MAKETEFLEHKVRYIERAAVQFETTTEFLEKLTAGEYSKSWTYEHAVESARYSLQEGNKSPNKIARDRASNGELVTGYLGLVIATMENKYDQRNVLIDTLSIGADYYAEQASFNRGISDRLRLVAEKVKQMKF